MTAPIYHTEGYQPTDFARLKDVISKLDILNPPEELMKELQDAVKELEIASQATQSITRGRMGVGYGVSKEKKNIACDHVSAVIKAIRASKGW